MRAYSTDFRHSIVRAYEAGQGSQRRLAQMCGVSLGFVQQLLKRYRETGQVAPKPHGGGQVAKLRPHQERVRPLHEQAPDATLAELCEQVASTCQVHVSAATMSRTLQRLGLSRKKNFSGRRA